MSLVNDSFILLLQNSKTGSQRVTLAHKYFFINSVLASLSLSLKISVNKSYSAGEIAALANRSLSASDLIAMEGTIL